MRIILTFFALLSSQTLMAAKSSTWCGSEASAPKAHFNYAESSFPHNMIFSPFLTVPSISPKLYIHVQAVRAQRQGELDPANIPTVTPTEVDWAVGQANQVLAMAGIELLFDPATDFEPNILMDSYLANDYVPTNSGEFSNPENQRPHVDSETFNSARNEYAKRYLGKIVLFFVPGNDLIYDKTAKRWNHLTKRGFGYANSVDNYVAMTSDIGGDYFLAHEIGHYFHLPHTHGPLPETNAEAIQSMSANSYDLERTFNGDVPYIFDTPADPGPTLFTANGLDLCGTVNDVPVMVPDPDGNVINYILSPDRTNIMSYFKACTTFAHTLSNEQIERVRHSIFWGNRQHLLAKEWTQNSPELVSWGQNRLDLVALGTDTSARHISRDNNNWSGWEFLGGHLLTPPSIVSWAANRADLFALGDDDSVHHKAMIKSGDHQQWYPSQATWENLGGKFFTAPIAIAPAPDRLEVFGQGADSGVWHKSWASSVWEPGQLEWENLGGKIIGRPSVLTRLSELHLFAQGADKAVWTKSFSSHAWHPSTLGWTSLGGSVSSDVASASSPDKTKIYLAVRGADTSVWFKSFDGENWSPSNVLWQPLGGLIMGTPSMISRQTNAVDIFVRGKDGALWYKAMNQGQWSPSGYLWQSLGGQLKDDPKAVVIGPRQMEVYAVWTDGTYRRREWNNGQWTDWLDMGRYIE